MLSRQSNSKQHENLLFLKQLLKNPKALGAIAPSSKALTEMIAHHVKIDDNSYVVEVGAGTGRFTRGLLKTGIDPTRLIVVELDAELCAYLKQHFPDIKIIQGDATLLHDLLPPDVVNNVHTIISGIPLINLNKHEQSALVSAFKNTLSPIGQILQFTYGPISPLSHKKLGLTATRLGHVFFNVPPATVWSYTFHEQAIPKTKRHQFRIYVKAAKRKASNTFRRVKKTAPPTKDS